LTYDATLAELTSLEEMMRYMMDDNHIHSDVVNMLWQIYSECEHQFVLQSCANASIIRF